jgi:CheY-like chemotaxis protein
MTALKVLVVEDDAMIGLLLAEMLKDLGFDVCGVAASEDAAVAEAARCRPDLMIVDQNLRGGSGASAVEQILRDGPVPVIFIGGGLPDPLWPRLGFLRKPFLESDLVRAIQHALGTRAAASPLTDHPDEVCRTYPA